MKRIAGQQVNLRYCIRCYYILVVCTITCKCCTKFTTKFCRHGNTSIAVSLTALFSGMFVVGAGGLADKIGRVKMTNIGLLLSIIGSALIIITNLPALLILGRIIQGVSAACIMPPHWPL